MDRVVTEIGCKVEKLPTKYLGLPLPSRTLSLQDLSPIVNIAILKLVAWKGSLLSMVGCLALVKSMIFEIPVYHLYLFKMPMTIQ